MDPPYERTYMPLHTLPSLAAYAARFMPSAFNAASPLPPPPTVFRLSGSSPAMKDEVISLLRRYQSKLGQETKSVASILVWCF